MKDSDFVYHSRKVLPLIYVIETSRAMQDLGAEALYDAMQAVTRNLAELDRENADALMKIGVLFWGDSYGWMYPGLKSLKDFQWENSVAAEKGNLGQALFDLENKLSRQTWLKSDTGVYRPIIIFVGCSTPTDTAWCDGLEALRNNNWYRAAAKLAVVLGENAQLHTFEELTKNPDAVIRVPAMDQLKPVMQKAVLMEATIRRYGPEEMAFVVQELRDVFPDVVSDSVPFSEWADW